MSGEKSKSTPRIDLIHEITKSLFMKFSAIYGNLWGLRMPTADAVKIAIVEWADALRDIPAERINAGLKKCRDPFSPHADNPPTIGQFIRLCLPTAEDVGLPADEEAYNQACNYERIQAHPMVMQAVNQIGSFTFRMMTAVEGRKRFMTIYKQLKAREVKAIAANSCLMLEDQSR